MKKMHKFNRNDLITNGNSIGLVCGVDKTYYYITWMGGGDSMLRRDFVEGGYQKMGDFKPGTADEIMIYGRMLRV